MAKDISLERTIGALVRLKRVSVGLTQEELGARIGVSYQQVQKYETGVNRIAVSTLMRIAVALGVTASALVVEMETPAVVKEPAPMAQRARGGRGRGRSGSTSATQ